MHQFKRYFVIGTVSFLLASCATGTTLSDNLLQVPALSEAAFSSNWLASSFRTDGQSYLLSTVALMLSAPADSSAALFLFSDQSDKPWQELGGLAELDRLSTSPSIVSISGRSLPLEANSLYWIVLTSPNGFVSWAWTESVEGTGSGFTHTWAATKDGGSTWFTADYEPQLMAVVAEPVTPASVPEPTSCFLFAVGFSLVSLAIGVQANQKRQ